MNKLFAEIVEAETRIRPYTLVTPLIPSLVFSKQYGAEVYLKMESEQYTGSFKARGSMNKFLAQQKEIEEKGFIAASTGNHGQGVARAASLLGAQGTIYLPMNADKGKVQAIQNYGVDIQYHGSTSLDTEIFARAEAEEKGKVWISPYNDPYIVAGQGTVGIELLNQQPDLDVVFVTIGGGGLISGIATYLKEKNPHIKIVGCLPENSPEMALAVKAGHHVTFPGTDTLSSASAGGFEEDSITFGICRNLVDSFVLVSETEIREAILSMLNAHHKVIEGAAAVALAAFLKTSAEYKGKNVGVVLSGANLSTQLLQNILENK
ncbi:threonine/serine dehydratase [Patescibacteria group bacterium]|nr:threonine/serine dehydratase [Patescibacteria group bacterium]